MAERVGFEPTALDESPVFKTGSLNHSDISPHLIAIRGELYITIGPAFCQAPHCILSNFLIFTPWGPGSPVRPAPARGGADRLYSGHIPLSCSYSLATSSVSWTERSCYALTTCSGALFTKPGLASLALSFSSSALFFFSSFSRRAFSFSRSTSSARGMDTWAAWVTTVT